MSIIGKKIYKINNNDYKYYNFAIFSNNVNVDKIIFDNKISTLSSLVQDEVDNANNISCIGEITNYSINVNYDVKLNSSSKPNFFINDINFRGFTLFLEVKNSNNNIIYIKCSDTQVIKYYNFYISAFEGYIYSDSDYYDCLPIFKDKIYKEQFELKTLQHSPYTSYFEIKYNCSLKFKNKNYNKILNEEIDPDNEKFNAKEFGYKILKHYDFGQYYKEKCSKKVKSVICKEFTNIKNEESKIYKILESFKNPLNQAN